MRGEGKIFPIIENSLDLLLNMAALSLAHIFVHSFWLNKTALSSLPVVPLLFLGTLALSLIYQLSGIYRPLSQIGRESGYFRIVLTNLCGFGVFSVITIIFSDDVVCRFVLWCILLGFIISTVTLIVKRRLVIGLVRFLQRQRYIVHRVIIVGDSSESARHFIKEVAKDPQSGIMILGCVGMKTEHGDELLYLGGFEDLPFVLREYRPEYAVFAMDSYDKEKLTELVALCDDRCIKVYFLPVIYGFFKSSRQIENLGDLPMINIHKTPLDVKFNTVMKRIVDILGALLLIFLALPVMIWAAVGVKLSSPGPILFKQVRVGRLGREFVMLKFRSMSVGDVGEAAWSTGKDTRKTKFGNLLRRTSIDELPQLFNVLAGDMSLVGPRPEIPKFVEKFKKTIPLYMVKHYVKPGMTGLAQINGLRGDTSLEERIEKDIYYIENWSLLLDFKILFKTPFAAINKSEVYVTDKDHTGNGG